MRYISSSRHNGGIPEQADVSRGIQKADKMDRGKETESTDTQTADRLDRQTLGKGAKCNLENPSQFTPWLHPLRLPLFSPLSPDTRWLTSLGTPAGRAVSSAEQLCVPGWWVRWICPLQAEAGGGPGLQRQVGAVVPSLPDSAVISGQGPLQVGHGHRFLEVNHGIGV